MMAGQAYPLIFISAILLAACAAQPPKPGSDAQAIAVSSAAPSDPLERHLLARAQEAMAREDWFDATMYWEILQLVRPEMPEYARQLQKSQARADAEAASQLRAAEAARGRGEMELARVAYLKALRFDPDDQTALAGLRAIEKSQMAVVFPTRAKLVNTVPRPGNQQARPQAAPYTGVRQQLDLGILLFRQGDYASSIQILEKCLRDDPQDETARRYLADAHQQLAQQRLRAGKREDALASLEAAHAHKGKPSPLAESIRALRAALADDFYEQGVRAYYTDIGQAITLWERGLRYDPGHKSILSRLTQARQVRQNLKALEGKFRRAPATWPERP